jgi:hypothetical protein
MPAHRALRDRQRQLATSAQVGGGAQDAVDVSANLDQQRPIVQADPAVAFVVQ